MIFFSILQIFFINHRTITYTFLFSSLAVGISLVRADAATHPYIQKNGTPYIFAIRPNIIFDNSYTGTTFSTCANEPVPISFSVMGLRPTIPEGFETGYALGDFISYSFWRQYPINDDVYITTLSFQFSGSRMESLINTRIYPNYLSKEITYLHPKDGDEYKDINMTIPVKVCITLMLSGKAIGGVVPIPPAIQLLSINAYVKTPEDGFGAYSTVANVILYTSGFIPVPARCKISIPTGENVNFGSVLINSLDDDQGSALRRSIVLNYHCNTPETIPASVYISGQRSTFSDSVIASNIPAVGIELRHENNPVKPSDNFITKITNGRGGDMLEAVLRKDPKVALENIPTGSFRADAVLILQSE